MKNYYKLQVAKLFQLKKIYLNIGVFGGYIRVKESSDLSCLISQLKENWLNDLINDIKHFGQDTSGCIVDLGSNIGLTTKRLSCFFSKNPFVLVEMDKENIEFSKCNTTEIVDIEFVNYAVSTNSNSSLFYSKHVTSNAYSTFISPTFGESIIEVRTISIDDILASCKTPILLIKMDIEGSEKQFFQNGEQNNHWLKKVKYFYLEYHNFNKNDIQILLQNLGNHSHEVIGEYDFWDAPGWGCVLSKLTK